MKPKLFTQKQVIAFLKARQQELKMTTVQFANLLGVSHVLLYQIYKGKILPGTKVGFRKISETVKFEKIGDE